MNRAVWGFVVVVVAAVLLPGVLIGQSRAGAQGEATPAQDARPTLPPTWTPTPARLPTETPRAIPTQEPTLTATPTLTLFPTPPPPPRAARLTGVRLVWQTFNGCAPAALTIMLLYHGWDGNRDICARALKPYRDDVSVRNSEMAAFVEAEGLRAVVRTGGTLDILRVLIAAGFPVLAENVYDPGGDWMGHNRVIMGYDDDAGALYTVDSVLGDGPDHRGRAIAYDVFDADWQPFNRTYLVVYPPEAESRVRALLGPQWNATYNAEWTLSQAEQELARDVENAFAWFNLGTAMLALGRASEAAVAFERAQALRLPWRFLWYQFGPFEAYLQLGRYDDVIALGQRVLNTTRGVEEVYYYLGRAYAGLGEFEQAAAHYERALARNEGFVEAQIALSRLDADAAAIVP